MEATRQSIKKSMELLKKADTLPKNPCKSCGMGCIGCPSEQEYNEAWKPYKDSHIMGVAEKIIEAHELTARMEKLAEELGGLMGPEEMKALKIPVPCGSGVVCESTGYENSEEKSSSAKLSCNEGGRLAATVMRRHTVSVRTARYGIYG